MEYSIQSFLDALGLSKQEAVFYLTALESGPSKIVDLARRAGVHRVAAYALADRLTQKGLIRESVGPRSALYEAVHPREIEQLLKKQKRAIRKLELKFEDLLPQFVALYNRCSVRPRVSFYEGATGLEQMHQDVIDTMKELPVKERIIHSYSNPSAIQEHFEDHIEHAEGFVSQRMLYRIKNHVLAPDNHFNAELQRRDGEHFREMLLVPEKLFPFKNDITLYHQRIGLQGFQHEFVGVIIESKEIYDDQRAIFGLAWQGARIHVSL